MTWTRVDERSRLGTCGVVVTGADHMGTCLDGVDLARTSCAMSGDLSPFTPARLHAWRTRAAQGRRLARTISGTSNQSDCLFHFVANHMFFRIAPPGARRILVDHIAWCGEHLPRWNPLSWSASICSRRAQHLPKRWRSRCRWPSSTRGPAHPRCRGPAPGCVPTAFHVLLHISLSFFEEYRQVSRRTGRIWARLARNYGSPDPRSTRFKFHAATCSGVDLTRNSR